MEFRPHPYQRTAIDRILTSKSVGLLLDMGLGKTVITLTAIKELMYERGDIDRVLIIAPLQTAINTWTGERDKWDNLKDLRISLVLGALAQRKKALAEDADIYVVNRENTEWLFANTPAGMFDMLVVDELSSFKNPSAKRFKALKKQLPFFRRVVGLTGTPAPNGYMDLWSEMYILDRGEQLGKTITKYRQMYFYPGWTNGQIVYSWTLRDGAKEAIDRRLGRLCVSMKAVDFLAMPDKIESEVFVSMSKKERRIYDDFVLKHVIPEENIVAKNAASVSGKLLQMANGFAYNENREVFGIHDHKLEALDELIEAAQEQPVLVYYSFVADKERILERFKDAVELKGKCEVDAWNAGRIKILLAHPASAGHGLNLQAGGNIMVWYGLPWSLELYQQANARLYRQGQTKPVYIYHLLTKDTHDEDVLKALQQKNITQEELLKALKARLKNEKDKS